MPAPLVLAADVEHEIVERKSRFITRLHRVSSIEEAEALIRAARAEHPDARHHCTAVVLAATESTAPVHRSNDDGEPSGTAGMPILQALLGAGVEDVVAIVIRYFGGVKLGAGGLTRTYGRAVTETVEEARGQGLMRERREARRAEISVGFDLVGTLENHVRTWCAARPGRDVTDVEYGSGGAQIHVVVPPNELDSLEEELAAWTSGRGQLRVLGSQMMEVPL